MGRWASGHRFVQLFSTLLLFVLVPEGFANPQPSAKGDAISAQATAQQTVSEAASSATAKSSEQTKTEQYTLSHDRYEKAVAYSRAGYTLYFLYYILGGLFLFLILRLGIAARLRDIAENASEKRWVQGLVFVPLLLVLVDVLDLPVEMYWHRLSLHYEQSVQGWSSWFWDWTKGECLTVAFGIVLAPVSYTHLTLPTICSV